MEYKIVQRQGDNKYAIKYVKFTIFGIKFWKYFRKKSWSWPDGYNDEIIWTYDESLLNHKFQYFINMNLVNKKNKIIKTYSENLSH
jgi:hypothetical protein